MAVWMVRGGSSRDDAEQDFLESRSVGIYFGADMDISKASDAVLRSAIRQNYTNYLKEQHKRVKDSAVEAVVTRFLNQVLQFRDDIRLGDTIVMPRKAFGGHRVAHGIVERGYEYRGSERYRHRRQVRWVETEVPRDRIGRVWSLSDQRTVFRIDGG